MTDGQRLCSEKNTGMEDLLTNTIQRVTELEIRDEKSAQEINKLKHNFMILEQKISSLNAGRQTVVLDSENMSIVNKTIHSQAQNEIKDSADKNISELQKHELIENPDDAIDDIHKLTISCARQHEKNMTKENQNAIHECNIIPDGAPPAQQEILNDIPDMQLLHKDLSKEKQGTYDNGEHEHVTVDTEESKYFPHYTFWNGRANEENTSARNCGFQYLRGMHTVLCVDTSASMSEENGWLQVRTFISDYLNGLEELASHCHTRIDNVALAIFGNDTKVAKRLTNDYQSVLHTFKQIKPGGPSPMYGGLAMAIAAVDSAPYGNTNINGTDVQTSKIVLITDGNATESSMYQGPDEVDSKYTNETNAQIISKTEEIASRPVDFFIVPVGNVNSQLIEFMVEVGGGTLIQSSEGRTFSNRLLQLAGMSSTGQSDVINVSSIGLTKGDRELYGGKKGKLESGLKTEPDFYHESNDKDIPTVGSRVIRGPDWKYDDADGEGPGTVIGHSSGSKMYIEWDFNANINEYRYSEKFGYDVLLIDQTRKITDGCGKKIAVGFLVQPGKDFEFAAGNVSRKDRGVVIKVLTPEEDMVLVRWTNFKRVRGKYSFGKNCIYEVELCTQLQPEDEFICSRSQRDTKTIKKCKNKNI